MKTVTIDGEVYTKAGILAEQFGYTSDYLGQLCRADKVDAKLVGRSWYVNEFSLNRHKDSRYEALRGNEIISKIKVEHDGELSGSKVSVRPTLSKLTRRSVPDTTGFHWEHRAEVIPLATYEYDDYELVPESKVSVVEMMPEKTVVQVDEAIKIPIRVNSKSPYNTGFSAVTQQSLNRDIRFQNADAPDSIVTEGAAQQKNKAHSKSKKRSIQSSSFTPEMVKSAELSSASSSIVPLSFTLALVIALLIITLDTQIVTNGFEINSRLIFTTASLEQIFTILNF